MSSPLLSALAKLDDSVRVLEERLDRLYSGLEVSKDQFVQNLTEVRANADAVRELVRAKSPDADWTDRQSLEKLIRDLEANEAGRKELRQRKLLELAQELSTGTITHRLKSRVKALEGLRDSAVRDLQTEAAKEEPQDLPGPQAFAWMQWACGFQENANAARFSELEREFPALVRFVGEMEESYWQPSESKHEIPEQAAIDENPSKQEAPIQSPHSQLPELPPALAGIYNELFPEKPNGFGNAARTTTVATAVARAPEAQTVKPLLSSTDDSSSNGAQLSTAPLVHTHPGNGSFAIERSPEAAVVVPPLTAEPVPVEPQQSTFQPYSAADTEPVEEERRGFRLRFNRSVLITVGATAAIVLAMVGISAVSGNVTGKRGSSSAPPASDSPKETSAATAAAPVSDLELVGQIEQRLKAIKGSSIYVTVQHGTVILQGEVPSEDDLSMAEELTLQSSQVKVVRNRLQIEKAGALHSTSRPTKPAAVTTQ